MANSVKVSLEVKDEAANRALSGIITASAKADAQLKKMGESGSTAFSEIALHIGKTTGVWEIFQGNLAANLAIKGIEALTAGAKKLFDTFVVEGIAAASGYSDALNRLNISLAQNGNLTGNVSAELEEYAAKIQETTKFGDDAVLSNMAILESLTGLSKDGLIRATDAAINMASALQMDLGTAMGMIAKSSEGNVTAFQKQGIAIEKGRNNAQTFANVLTTLEQKFGGSAQKEIESYAGAVTRAGHNFEDWQKSVGMVITQNPAVVAAINAVSEAFAQNAESINGNSKSYKELTANLLISFLEAARLSTVALDYMVRAFSVTFNSIKALWARLSQTLIAPLYSFSDTAKELWHKYAQHAIDAHTAIENNFKGNTTLNQLATDFGNVEAAAQKGLEAIRSGSETSTSTLKNETKVVKELSDAKKAQLEVEMQLYDQLMKKAALPSEDFKARAESIKASLEEQLTLIQENYGGQASLRDEQILAEQDAYATYFSDRQSTLLAQYQNEDQMLKDLLANKKINEEQYYAARAQLGNKLAADNTKLIQEQKKQEAELTKQKQRENQQRLADTQSSLAMISTLMTQKNRKLFEIGKAAAIANAIINTAEGVSKALALGPILGPPLAVLVGVAGAAQVATISQQNPAFADGGIVPGSSFSGDRITANVNSGEMIFNRSQQQSLFKMVSGGSGTSNDGLACQVAELSYAVAALASQPISIQVDGREIARATRDQLASGRTI